MLYIRHVWIKFRMSVQSSRWAYVTSKTLTFFGFNAIGKFRIPRRPGMSMITTLMRVNFFAKTKTNIANLPLSRRKTIEILKQKDFKA